MSSNECIEWFKNTKEVLVKVDDKEYPNVIGTPILTGRELCYYVNGFKSSVIGKNKNFLRIDIFTCAGHVVDVEEKYLFKIVDGKYKIVKWYGWYDIDLLKIGNFEPDMLDAIYKKNSQN